MLPHQYIFQNRHIIKKTNILECPRYTTFDNLVWRKADQCSSIQAYITRCWTINPGNKIKYRRFTCAIGANHADNFARLNLQIHILDGNQATKTFGDYAEVQQSVRSCPGSLSSGASLFNAHKLLYSYYFAVSQHEPQTQTLAIPEA